MKSMFDRKAKERYFKEGDLVLRWDERREDKGKHGKFDNLWFWTFSFANLKGKNTFILQNLEGQYSSLPINGKYLRHYIQYWDSFIHSSFTHHCIVFIFNQCVIVFNRDPISPRRRHMDLQVLWILQEEEVPSWSRCCNINGFDKLDIYKIGYKK